MGKKSGMSRIFSVMQSYISYREVPPFCCFS